MAISTNPDDPNFGLETDETSPNFGLAVETPSGIQGGLQTAQKVLGVAQEAVMDLYRGGGAMLNRLMFPEQHEWEQHPIISPEVVQPIRKALQYPVQTLKQIVTGEEFQEPFPEAGKFASEQIAGQTSPEALALLAAGGIIGKMPKLREIAFGKPPQVPPEIPSEYAERRFTMVDTPPTETELAAVNKELAPVTEPPEATAVAPEPFPSITQSGEAQRRAELQQPQAQQVRQAISLDELRLMRERSELQLQNDLSRRATGNTHPAVDERLGQIDEELTNIANRELQTEGGGEISATKEGVIPESNIPEYTRDGESRPPAEAGGGGGVVPSPEIGGTRPTEEAVTPPEAGPQPPAAAAPEAVGIAERYREEQQPGSVLPGVGKTSEEARAWGHDFINKGGNPYDIVNQKGPKRELWQDVGGVRAEYERLSNEKRAAEAALEADPANPNLQKAFDNADAAQLKWSQDMQPVLTRAGDALRAASRAYPREITSFSDFTDIANDHFKGDVEWTPEKRAELQKAVKVIRKTKTEINDTRVQDVNGAIKKAGGKVMSFDELKADLRGTVEQLLKDCVL